MKEFLEIAPEFLAALGGGSIVIAAMIKYSANNIATALQKRYQLELDERFETYKSQLNKQLAEDKSRMAGKRYVSKAYFDREIEINQQVSKAMCNMVRDISLMIPSGCSSTPIDKNEAYKENLQLYHAANISTGALQNVVEQNAPFITEEIYEMVNEIRSLCKMQLEEFVELFDNTDLGDRHKKISHDAYERTEEINKMYKEYVKLVRDYLKTLEIA